MTSPLPRKRQIIQGTDMAEKKSAKPDNLARELERWYKKICTPAFIDNDPVQFPRMFKKREDIEIAAFLCATIAWGKRELIIRSCKKMFGLLGNSPYDFIMSGNYRILKKGNIHRTFFETDLVYFCRGFKACYSKYGSLENLFASVGGTSGAGKCKIAPADGAGIWKGIALFRKEMAIANGSRYLKHVANPGIQAEEADLPGARQSGSACKKANLALRWLVRKDAVDIGIWKNIKPSSLYIPLDLHVSRAALRLGLLERKASDKRAVIELTERLREFCPEDPVKYDFALFGMSIENALDAYTG
jgi:uncharacterized protein (TIGR02757 family)